LSSPQANLNYLKRSPQTVQIGANGKQEKLQNIVKNNFMNNKQLQNYNSNYSKEGFKDSRHDEFV
jgi:hypothetical protein|tara:strand:+ start:460 stop:654 length:195 start_codon:yes stop_codon:yes gene_type:complete